MLSLPSTVLVGRKMPKRAFYEHLRTTAPVRDQFVNGIERIELVASIKEETVHIPAGESVVEIDVLALYLKDGAELPVDAVTCIAKAVPNRLLFVCVAGEHVRLGVMLGELFWTEPAPLAETGLVLRGSNLDELWDSVCSQVVFGDDDPADFLGRLGRARELASAREELEKLRRRLAGERQIRKRNELFDRMRSIKKRIYELEESR